jgi:hypothetical protein
MAKTKSSNRPAVKSKRDKVPNLDWSNSNRNHSTLKGICKAIELEKETIIDEVMAKEEVSKQILPVKGQQIYIPSSLHVYRGKDDIAGGLATIDRIEFKTYLSPDNVNYIFVGVECLPDTMYNWKHLLAEQEELKEQYGNQIAHPDPDCREEFNQPDADWH